MMDCCIGVIQLTYPLISLVAASYTLLGAYLGSDNSTFLTPVAGRAALVVGLIVSYSFAFNHYQDVAVDSVNNPARPIPSGRVPRKTAGIVALFLAVSAIALASTTSLPLLMIALFNTILSTLYSCYFKGIVLVGNATIAILDASIVVYGNLAVGVPTRVAWIVCLLTFSYVLAQEILYTVRDCEGDLRGGLRTVATCFGTVVAIRLFSFFTMGFIAIALLIWLLGLAPDRYLYAVVPCCVLPLFGIVCFLKRNVTIRKVRLSLLMINIVWVLSLFPAILLK
jgi:4-hydroxybenzoate polyprenyltransferase